MINRKNNHSKNSVVMLKQKYILRKTWSKTHLRFLIIIFILSVRNLFDWVMLLERFPLFFQSCYLLFSSCYIIMNTIHKIYLNQHFKGMKIKQRHNSELKLFIMVQVRAVSSIKIKNKWHILRKLLSLQNIYFRE